MVCDVSRFLLNDLRDFILCLESASAYHDLTTYCDTPLTLYNIKSDMYLKTAHIVQYPKPQNIDILEDCAEVRKGFWVTGKERTICEMIKNDREEFFIYEALENYEGDFEVLKEYARKYGVLSKIKYYLRV
jgi:hypothetical protein